MIKGILVALDDSPSSLSAQHVGVSLSKHHQARLTGIGIIDEPWISAPEAIPLGGASFKVELDEKLLVDARRLVHKREKAFIDFCKSQDVSCSIIDTTGIPSYEIENFLIEFDLLVIGKEAHSHFTLIQDTAVSVKQLIKDNPRPLIVTGATLPSQKSTDILVAFDGTFAASRALHMALLLGLFKGKAVHIANIASSMEEAQNNVTAAATLCKNHGVKTHLHPLVLSQNPAKVLVDLSEELKPSLIVMGAYGHGKLEHFFFGSCAEEILKSTDIPVFFSH